MAKVLLNLGTKAAMIVHSEDGLDEISLSAKTRITQLKNKRVSTYYVQPKNFGLRRSDLVAIQGGSKEVNAAIILNILKGQRGPARDVAVMNASAALVIMENARDFADGVKIASESVDSGQALEKLELLKHEK